MGRRPLIELLELLELVRDLNIASEPVQAEELTFSWAPLDQVWALRLLSL